MTLKNITPSDRNQTPASTYCMIPFISNSGEDKSNQKQQKADRWPPGSGWLRPAGKGTREPFRELEMFYHVAMAVKTPIAELKSVPFLLCTLHLKKADFF